MLNLPTAEDFRILRARLRLTQAAMGAHFGVSGHTYRAWESGMSAPRAVSSVVERFAALSNPKAPRDAPKLDGRTERARINREADIRRFMEREKAQAGREGKDFIPFLEAKLVVNRRIAANPIKSVARTAREMVDYLDESLRLLGASSESPDVARELELEREKRALLLEKLDNPEEFP